MKDLEQTPAAPTQSEEKQRRMHKQRLRDEFFKALNNFQSTQRNAAEKEKASVKRARAASGLGVNTLYEFNPRVLVQSTARVISLTLLLFLFFRIHLWTKDEVMTF